MKNLGKILKVLMTVAMLGLLGCPQQPFDSKTESKPVSLPCCQCCDTNGQNCKCCLCG